MNEKDKTINQRIVSCRKLAGLSQTEIANYLGMKTSTYSQKERKGNIDCDFLLEIAEFFDVDVRYLLFGDKKYLAMDFDSPSVDEVMEKNNENTQQNGYILNAPEISIIKMFRVFPTEYKKKTLNFIRALNKLVNKT